MRILGLDLGTKTLGIALSDPLGIIASGIETFRFDEYNYESAIARVGEMLKSYDIKTIVLGLPLHMSGEMGDMAKSILEFKQKLIDIYDIRVILYDERMTTKIATANLITANVSRKKRKNVVDKMAAVVILQNYLDFSKNKEEN